MTAIQRDALAAIVEILEEARRRVVAAIADQPSDYQAWRLPQLKREIERALAVAAERQAAALHEGAAASAEAGADLLDAPLAAAGVDVNEALRAAAEISGPLPPRVDLAQLEGLKATLTHLARKVTTRTADRITSSSARSSPARRRRPRRRTRSPPCCAAIAGGRW